MLDIWVLVPGRQFADAVPAAGATVVRVLGDTPSWLRALRHGCLFAAVYQWSRRREPGVLVEPGAVEQRLPGGAGIRGCAGMPRGAGRTGGPAVAACVVSASHERAGGGADRSDAAGRGASGVGPVADPLGAGTGSGRGWVL